MSIFESNRNIILKKITNELFPLVYKGIKSIYDESTEVSKTNPKETLKNFQVFLKKIPDWTEEMIVTERKRIELESNNLFESIKVYLKLTLIQLTGYNIKTIIRFSDIGEIDINKYIHSMYISIARDLYSNPLLIYDKVPAIEYKKNQLLILDIIKEAITSNLINLLPWEEINTRLLMSDEVDMLNLNTVRTMTGGGDTNSQKTTEEKNDKVHTYTDKDKEEINKKLSDKKDVEKLSDIKSLHSAKKTTEDFVDKMITPSKLPHVTTTDMHKSTPINAKQLDEKDKKILEIINEATNKDSNKNEKYIKSSEKKSVGKKSSEKVVEKVVKLQNGGNDNQSSINKLMKELKDSETEVSHVPESEDGYSGYAEVFTNKNMNTEEKAKKLSKNKYFSNYLKV